MVRLSILLFLTVQCFTITACLREEPEPSNSFRLVAQRDSIVDFHRFLGAIKLLVAQQESSLDLTIRPNEKKLSFISSNGSPGEPVIIYVLRDQVAMGSGPSRQLLTVEQLRERLKEFANAASKTGSHGVILLASDRQVSGDFGLVVLDAMVDSGISTVMLLDPDLDEAPVSTPSKKPSPPTAR